MHLPSSDAVLRKTKAAFTCGGEEFTATGTVLKKPGFMAVMPWREPLGDPLPPFSQGAMLELDQCELHQASCKGAWKCQGL